MTAAFFEDLAGLARRAVQHDLTAAVQGFGQLTFQASNDIHLAPDREDVSVIALHRAGPPYHVMVSFHLLGGFLSRADLEDALGSGRRLPQVPDAPGRTDYLYAPPPSWRLPKSSEVSAEIDRHDVVQVLAVDVPIADATLPAR